jgi:predicted HicB family RNase H-like nuclease
MTSDTHQMTVRLPGSLYERLRREAFERRTSMNEVVIESLQERLAESARENPEES